MRIQSIPYNYPNYYNYVPAFKRNLEKITDVKTSIACFGNTMFFRRDLAWDKLSNFLANKFKNADKVTFINHACSSGEEPYSVVMKLISDLGTKANKFFPIIAKDLSPSNIEKAQNGRIVGYWDEERMTRAMTTPITDSLVEIKPIQVNDYLFIMKPTVKDKIQFSVGDVLKDIDNIPEKNTVLFIRNCFKYMEPQDREKLISKIADKFKDDSCVLFLGEVDTDHAESNVNFLLDKYGFENAGFPRAYIKGSGPTGLYKYLLEHNNGGLIC